MIAFLWKQIKKLFEIKVIVEKPIFIHCFDTDTRTKKEKWNDINYINSVKMLSENKIWVSEMLLALGDARKLEERAKTKDEWEAKHEAVKTIMSILRLPQEATLCIEALKSRNKAKAEYDLPV